MAQRRMFSKTITNSGKFLKMPATSRLLYYDLGMNADDDGFAEWFTIVRMTGAAEQDLKVLEANGFVRIFDENVLVIQDWKENNYLRPDRHQPSKYLEKYEQLPLLNLGIPNDNHLATQVRLGKVRIGKNTPEQSSEGFVSFWDIYPPTRKQDKQKCLKKWQVLLAGEPELEKTILADLEKRTKKHEDWIKDQGRYVPAPLVYLNNRRWEAPIVEAKGGNQTYKV